MSVGVVVLVVRTELHPVVIIVPSVAVELHRVSRVSAVAVHDQSILVGRLVADPERPVLHRSRTSSTQPIWNVQYSAEYHRPVVFCCISILRR